MFYTHTENLDKIYYSLRSSNKTRKKNKFNKHGFLFTCMSNSFSHREYYIQLSSGVKLKVNHFVPKNKTVNKKVVFLPGWISTLSSWRYFISSIAEKMETIVIDSREKSTSIISDNSQFGINTLSHDLKEAISFLKLRKGEYYVAGSSLGASSILNALQLKLISPIAIALILPNAKFQIPRVISILKYLPLSIVNIIQKISFLYIVHFKTNKNDSDQRERIEFAIENADLGKLISSAIALSKYKLDITSLSNINTPTFIVNAKSDNFHNSKDISIIADNINNSTSFDCVTFSKSRSSNVAELVYSYFMKNT